MSSPTYPNDPRYDGYPYPQPEQVREVREVRYNEPGYVPPAPPAREVREVRYSEPGYVPPVNDRVVSSSEADGAYSENRREAYVDANGNLVQRHEDYFEDDYARRQNILDRAANIIYFLTGALEVLLLIRLVFRLLGADTGNGIVNFIYALSRPFVIAFNGIFSDQTLGRGSVFEFSTLIAMIMYALLAWGLVSLIYVLFEPGRSSRHSTVVTHRRRFE